MQFLELNCAGFRLQYCMVTIEEHTRWETGHLSQLRTLFRKRPQIFAAKRISYEA